MRVQGVPPAMLLHMVELVETEHHKSGADVFHSVR
jgi:hypothetical protein